MAVNISSHGALLADYTGQVSRIANSERINQTQHQDKKPDVEFLPRKQINTNDDYQEVSRYQQVFQQARIQRQNIHKLKSEKHNNPTQQANLKTDKSEDKNTQKNQLTKKAEENKKHIEQQKIAQLKARDLEVKQHEMAHMAAGGQHAGSAHYSYTKGPDGVQYAVSGEVSVDISKEQDPSKTIAKMQQVQRAALAPAEPSAQDRQVAAFAAQQINLANAELQKQDKNKTDKTQPHLEKSNLKEQQTDKSDDAKKSDKKAKAEKKKQAENKSQTDYIALYNKRRQEIYEFLQNVLQQPQKPQSPLLREKV